MLELESLEILVKFSRMVGGLNCHGGVSEKMRERDWNLNCF